MKDDDFFDLLEDMDDTHRVRDPFATEKDEIGCDAGDSPAARRFLYCRDLQSVREMLREYAKRKDERPQARVKRELLQRIDEVRGYAPYVCIPANCDEILDEFENLFPNMLELSEILRDQFALTAAVEEDAMLSLGTPLLLNGPQGVGKTFALNWLAKRLGTKSLLISCSDASNAFDLVGLSEGWGSAKAGHVVRFLVQHKCANPVVILDEIEKSPNDPHHGNILDAMYRLLEPDTAREFRDEFLGIPLDIRPFNWVATSNDALRLPAPIRDRFTIVNLRMPTLEERRRIIPSVWKQMLENEKWGRLFSTKLTESIVEMLADEREMSIRSVRNILRHAAGKALRRSNPKGVAKRPAKGSLRLQADDMRGVLRRNRESATSRSIGFIAPDFS